MAEGENPAAHAIAKLTTAGREPLARRGRDVGYAASRRLCQQPKELAALAAEFGFLDEVRAVGRSRLLSGDPVSE